MRKTLSLLVLLLTACALSPMTVDLAPTQPGNIQQLLAGSQFLLNVNDQRPQSHLGTRGGAYSDASEIHLARDLSVSFTPALRQGFIALGLIPANNAGGAIASGTEQRVSVLEVELNWLDLSYGSKGGLYPSYMTMAAEYEVVLRSSQGEYRNRYHMSRDRRFAAVPEAQESAEVLNQFISDALALMYSDADMRAWLIRR